MATVIVYCTSRAVQKDHFIRLNQTYSEDVARALGETEPKFQNYHTPARNDIDKIASLQEELRDLEIDYFEGQSDDQLRELFLGMEEDRGGWMHYFGVLDGDSVQNRTIDLHWWYWNHPDLTEADTPSESEDSQSEERLWHKWRVSWDDVGSLYAGFSVNTGLIHEVYIHDEDFTDENGVFRPRDCMEASKQETVRSSAEEERGQIPLP